MPRLTPPEYLQHIAAESTRFREVLAACDPSARVPSCPDWVAADLLWHLGEVQHWWAAAVRNRPQDAEGMGYAEPQRPTSYDELLAFHEEQASALAAALAAADPAEEAWTWSQDHTVAFILRRQAHEALIHRLDAELAAGRVTPLDPALASDGVEEVLGVMYGGLPPWGRWEPLPHYVRFDCTDTGARVWTQLGLFSGTDPRGTTYTDEEDVHVVDDPGVEADAVVSGLAGDLDAWLWRRRDDADIHVAGDHAVFDRFRAALDQPIE